MIGPLLPIIGRIGRRVIAVARVRYVVEEIVTSDAGPIELIFEDGTTVSIDAGPNGTSLKIRDEPWVDPFAGELSPENEEFVKRAGKWTRFDVSNEEPYAGLVGERLLVVSPVLLPSGITVGVDLEMGNRRLHAEVGGDDLSVEVA